MRTIFEILQFLFSTWEFPLLLILIIGLAWLLILLTHADTKLALRAQAIVNRFNKERS
jgi:hypothetical protein